MTPFEFVEKWRGVELKERSASQSHFNDLCALLGILDPVSSDKTGEWFAFEKGATKTGGGEGWADVWRKGCFAWEYKGKHANLDKALQQLLRYAAALDNPPLLIVSDMDRIRIHTNWTNTVQEVHEFATEELIDGAVRERLRAAFLDPEAFKPQKTRQALTEETAREFAGLAQRLRDRGHEPHEVAHFVNQLVFCMFAEDVGLLPDHLFTKMLEVSRRDPQGLTENCRTLFGAMAKKGGRVGFTAIEWFNGGLFTDDHVLAVSSDDIDELLHAAGRDWSQIDPSILGTLFERGLDPAKRSQLGAHYTDREKIMMIVRPVIIEPLEGEWAEALARMTALVENAPKQTEQKLLRGAELAKRTKALAEAEAIHIGFIERLAKFRVLDPACGSGNFLYVALRELKNIEHRANLDAEALGLPRGFPRVGPENVLGIELNPYAAELARVSVWIGEIQWMRRNGFDAAKNPILRPLETIECRDAVLNDDGSRAEWPAADVVIGNPPFLGNKKMIGELGEDYTLALRRAWPEVPGGVDLVCYWFAKAWAMMIAGKLNGAGMVATNSIRGGANREVLKPIVDQGRIYDAWSDEGWTVEGAAVRVSLVCFDRNQSPSGSLNGQPVRRIKSDLSLGDLSVDLTEAARLAENLSRSFIGRQKDGPVDIPGDLARAMIATGHNPHGRSMNPDSATVAIARDDDTSFGILHSRFHELWSLRMGTFLGVGNDPRYTPSTTFETFPFPEGLTPDIPAAHYADDPRAQKIAAAAARLNELRENWLNPPDLVVREPEVVPGYPDRILPKDEDAAKELKKRTLTNLYNARPQWLANAHAALDEAVAEAYGWGDDRLLADDEILARLFRLNQERAGAATK